MGPAAVVADVCRSFLVAAISIFLYTYNFLFSSKKLFHDFEIIVIIIFSNEFFYLSLKVAIYKTALI